MFFKIIPGPAQLIRLWNGTTEVDVENFEGVGSLKVVPGEHRTLYVHSNLEAIAATTGFMLVDLSDITNWPHTGIAHIDIESVTVQINPITAFRGDVELGYLSDVDADNGDFNVIFTWHFDQNADTVFQRLDFGALGHFHANATTPQWFGPVTANDAIWQTDVNLLGPDGNTSYPSGNGDLVLKITRSAGTVDASILVGYHTG